MRMRFHISGNSQQVIFRETVGQEEFVSYVELLMFQPWKGKDRVGYVHSVFTEEKYRDKGFATSLVAEALDYAKQNGCYKVFLVCRPEVKEWYEKNTQLKESGLQMQVILK